MRLWLVGGLLSGLLLAPVALAQSATDGIAGVSGFVKGVDGPAVVYLQASDDNPTRYYDGYQVSAERDGSFSFSEIKPGTYQVRAEAFGFMSAASDSNETKITLHANERRKGIIIAMVRRHALCGRITENGSPRPMPTWVSAFRYDPEFDTFSKTFMPRTEADGTYRFADLDQGTYYLQGYMTWYPGSFSFNNAKPVIVGPDSAPTTQCPLDIPLQYTGCHATKVSGHIAASSTDDNTQYRVNFLERNPNGGRVAIVAMRISNNLYHSGDSFSGIVCSGDYDVVLSDEQPANSWVESRSHKVIFDSQRVTVAQTEIDGLLLTPHPMATIAGEVHFEDNTRDASCPGSGGQHVDILREGDGQFQSAVLNDKNRFEIRNVEPGDYTIYLGPFSREAVYVKSIVINGKPVEGRRFSIPRAEPVAIDITLSGDLAHATGHLSPDLRRERRWEVAWTRPKGYRRWESQGRRRRRLHS